MNYFDEIFKALLGSFNLGYMLSVNVLTYVLIKYLDEINGKKHVKSWQKLFIAFLSGILIGGICFYNGVNVEILLYSFILSLVSWDFIFKPLINKIGIGYKNENKDKN